MLAPLPFRGVIASCAGGAACVLALGLGAISAAGSGGPLIVRSSTGQVRVDDSSSNAGFCPKGTSVASGGFANPSFNRKTSKLFIWGTNPVLAARPIGPAWRTTVANLGSSSNGRARWTVFAYCDRRHQRLHEVDKTVKVGPGERGAATVHCPKGSGVISGGLSDEEADLSSSRIFAIKSKRKGDRGWRGVAFNRSATHAGKLVVIGACQKDAPELLTRSASAHVPLRGTNAVLAHCPSGRSVLSGGFATSVHRSTGKGAFPLASMRVDDRTWRAAGFGNGAPGSIRAFAYCEPGA
jgi:hypothetical protein